MSILHWIELKCQDLEINKITWTQSLKSKYVICQVKIITEQRYGQIRCTKGSCKDSE
jgi:hypothetical protein